MLAGNLNRMGTFAEQTVTAGEGGEVITGFADRFRDWCHVRYLRGGESVMQARMASRRPVILTFRDSARARRVTSEWRVTIDGVAYEAKEDPRPSEGGGFLEMLAEA